MPRRLLQWLYPPRCQACGHLAGELLCRRCRADLPAFTRPRCQRCGEFLDPLARGLVVCADCRQRKREPLLTVRSAGSYASTLGELVRRFKYARKQRAGELLGELLCAWLREDAEAVGILTMPPPVALVPVPLHWTRRWSRGFNQSEILALALADDLGLPVQPVLRRVRMTRKQVGLSPDDRRRNVRGAFAVRGELLQPGARYLVVDDVYTTGATLRECAQTLRRAGAGEVVGLTAVRATTHDGRQVDPADW